VKKSDLEKECRRLRRQVKQLEKENKHLSKSVEDWHVWARHFAEYLGATWDDFHPCAPSTHYSLSDLTSTIVQKLHVLEEAHGLRARNEDPCPICYKRLGDKMWRQYKSGDRKDAMHDECRAAQAS
jgi:hypothetical protein